MTHPIDDGQGTFVGAMLVARNLGFMNQVHSTLNYSRKLAALGRLMAGVAHEVKNPLNAMTIHLELLKSKLARDGGAAVAVGARAAHLTSATAAATPASTSASTSTSSAAKSSGSTRCSTASCASRVPTSSSCSRSISPAVISDVVTTVTPEAERGR